jgi:hypothetical protein
MGVITDKEAKANERRRRSIVLHIVNFKRIRTMSRIGKAQINIPAGVEVKTISG